jgi:hypothetical protein
MTKWRGEQPDKTTANKITPGQERNTMLRPNVLLKLATV